MADKLAPGTPAGWYPDATGKAVWWDGAHWDFKAKPPIDLAIPGVTPAGWYPEGINGQRYWNGREWTGERAPLPPQKNPAATASLVLAIIAAAAAFLAGIPGILLAAVLLLLALVFGINGYNRSRHIGDVGRGVATAGILIAIAPIAIIVIGRALN